MSSPWPLVGRAEEFGLVCHALTSAGASGGVVVAGAAGVGKSRLAREASAHVVGSRRVCHQLFASESARSVPLGVFAEFAAHFGADPLRRIDEVITALTAARPTLSTVVSIDDAHLLDMQSALVVQQLFLRKAATVLLTLRSGEPAPDAITALYKDHGVPRLELQPLGPDDVASLLESALDGPVESASAQRLWRYTRGNVLYLRQLLEEELARGRLVSRYGVWVWVGHPEVSPTLGELIDANMGRHPRKVLDVLDIVATSEQVDMPVLLALVNPDAVSDAEARGLITVDSAADVVRPAHPLFVEARRRHLTTVRRRDLSRRLATSIGELCPPSPQRTVQRATLLADSHDPVDAVLFTEAANAALQLLDPALAVEFAERAMACGGGTAAQLTYALTLITFGNPVRGEAVIAELLDFAQTDVERAYITMLRAANLGWNLGSPDRADQTLSATDEVSAAAGLTSSYRALRASFHASRGRPDAALELLDGAEPHDAHPGAAMFAIWALVAAHGDLGDLTRLDAAARRGYQLAAAQPEASHMRFGLGSIHLDGLLTLGALRDASAVATELQDAARDIAPSQAMTALVCGMADLGAGNLASAQRKLRESLAIARDAHGSAELSGFWLITALAMAGDYDGACRQQEQALWTSSEEFVLWDPHRGLAHAWTEAAGGQVTIARETALAAADLARHQHRPAKEALCLQTATQFGDTSTADRLAELAIVVGGPRASAAAAHATALAADDGSGLLAASKAYEAFGDRVAAADAAAQSATVFRARGAKGSALTATSVAQLIAADTGADTIALRALAAPIALTPRQLEIISLAAAGLSNKEIAERLVMSVRSVEGHILRACQRTGIHSRRGLIALVTERTSDGDTTELT